MFTPIFCRWGTRIFKIVFRWAIQDFILRHDTMICHLSCILETSTVTMARTHTLPWIAHLLQVGEASMVQTWPHLTPHLCQSSTQPTPIRASITQTLYPYISSFNNSLTRIPTEWYLLITWVGAWTTTEGALLEWCTPRYSPWTVQGVGMWVVDRQSIHVIWETSRYFFNSNNKLVNAQLTNLTEL